MTDDWPRAVDFYCFLEASLTSNFYSKMEHYSRRNGLQSTAILYCSHSE